MQGYGRTAIAILSSWKAARWGTPGAPSGLRKDSHRGAITIFSRGVGYPFAMRLLSFRVTYPDFSPKTKDFRVVWNAPAMTAQALARVDEAYETPLFFQNNLYIAPTPWASVAGWRGHRLTICHGMNPNLGHGVGSMVAEGCGGGHARFMPSSRMLSAFFIVGRGLKLIFWKPKDCRQQNAVWANAR